MCMSNISDLESRISAAMDRIGRGLEGLDGTGDGAGTDEMSQALAEEKRTNGQLEERIRALSGKVDGLEADAATHEAALETVKTQTADEAKLSLTEAEAKSALLTDALAEALADNETDASKPGIDLAEGRTVLDDLARRLRRLRVTIRELRSSNQQLRESAEKGLSDPALINQALQAELNDLRAERDAEKAEIDAILAVLRPLLDTPPADEGDKTIEGDG